MVDKLLLFEKEMREEVVTDIRMTSPKYTPSRVYCSGNSAAGFIASRIFKHAENHVGWNILYLLPLFLGVLILSVFKLYLQNWSGFLCYLLIGLSLVSIALILCIYQFNVLVPYEIWLKRGMPSRPF